VNARVIARRPKADEAISAKAHEQAVGDRFAALAMTCVVRETAQVS